MRLLKKVINAVVGEETEEQRTARLEKENLIKNQIDFIDKMKCPICSHTEFSKGYISNSGAYGGTISCIATYHNGYNKGYKEKVMVCSTCGYVVLFADFTTMEIKQLT